MSYVQFLSATFVNNGRYIRLILHSSGFFLLLLTSYFFSSTAFFLLLLFSGMGLLWAAVLHQEDKVEEAFFKQPEKASHSQAVVLMGDFNHPDI